METSALADVNVRDAFEMLVQEIYNTKSREDLLAKRNQGGKKLVINDPSFEEKKTCGCM